MLESRQLPMVSILTPTCRPAFLKQCAKYVAAQTYPREKLEWVIVDSGDDFELPDVPGLRTAVVHQRSSVGMLRNVGAQVAAGDIIVHFDDDDWHSRDRIERQIVPFLVKPHLELVATDCYYVGLFDEDPVRAMSSWSWEFETYSSGGSFMYRKRAWRKFPFANIQQGEDQVFAKHVRMANSLAAVNLRDPTLFIAVRHGQNTCAFDEDVRQRATMQTGEWLRDMMGPSDFEATCRLAVQKGADELHQREEKRAEGRN